MLQIKAREIKYLLLLDKSADATDTSQLHIIICGLDHNFKLKILKKIKQYRTSRVDILEKVDHCIKNLELNRVNLSCLTTVGAPNMMGDNNISFIGTLSTF